MSFRHEGHRHDTAAEARDCHEETLALEATAEWEAQVGVCPICDGLGHTEASCGLVNSEIAHYEGLQDQLREAGLIA